MAQKKKSVMARRIETDPNFDRVRENIAEFKKAGKAAKLLLDAVRSIGITAKDRTLFPRLSAGMREVLNTDSINDRGLRTVVNGNMQLIKGFEFNLNSLLASVLNTQPVATIDRVSGTLKVDMPAFVPRKQLIGPFKATHFKLGCAAAEIDFAAGTFATVSATTADLPYDNVQTEAISLSNTVTAGSTKWLVIALGVQFSEQVNNKFYQLYNGKFNALSLVAVESPAA
jgi:hypothetical protein